MLSGSIYIYALQSVNFPIMQFCKALYDCPFPILTGLGPESPQLNLILCIHQKSYQIQSKGRVYPFLFIRGPLELTLLLRIVKHVTCFRKLLDWRTNRLGISGGLQWSAVRVTPSGNPRETLGIWISQEPWQVSQNGFGSP